MTKHFYLKTPQDLLSKLKWGINHLARAIEDEERFHAAAYFAFDCGITAWAMVDWVWKYHHTELFKHFGKKYCFADWVRAESDSLRICYQLANSAKHLGVDSHPDHNLTTEVEWETERTFSAGSSVGHPLVQYRCYFTVNDSGHRIEVLQVLEEAYQFWSGFNPETMRLHSSP